MSLEPLVQLSNVWSGVSGGFGVHLFEGKLVVADMERLEQVGRDYLARHPGKVVEVVVVFPSSSRMTGEERARMAKLMRAWEDRRVAAATVILASGILGSVHRSVLTGLLTLSAPSYPAKVFGEVERAVAWLEPYFAELPKWRASPGSAFAATRAFCDAFRTRPDAPPAP